MLLTKKESISQQQATMLVVIDPTVEAPHQLVRGVQAGTEVLFLDPHQDSIAQITKALTEGNYSSLHLVSHGSPGCLHLGNTDLNSETIAQYKQQLLEWGIAEILIYGCNVAANPDFLIKLHILTGASIAASAQEVGQGNWSLEWQIGEINSHDAFNEEIRQEYFGKFVGFLPPVTFTAGSNPSSVAIGDLDGDGDADDLAVVNALSNNVSVFLGDGSGGFSAQTTFSVGTGPRSVAIGDLDSDGFADDVAAVNLTSQNISILLGDGSGGFSAQATLSAGTNPFSVAIGDLDGDGNADDLAIANTVSNNVSVLLGDGSGGFSAQTTFSAGTNPFSIAIGDLDGDGNADDIAVANLASNNVSVLLGDGSGGFSSQTFSAGIFPRSVAIGDLDGDGNADDIVVANVNANGISDNDNVSVLLGDGSGGFSAANTFAVGFEPYSVSIGDLDGDGNADDIATANFNGLNVSVLLGDNSGGFSAQITFSAAGFNPASVAIGDLDGDNLDDDLVTANYYTNPSTITVLIECFLAGTRILTDKGEIVVESLKIEDKVKTADGKLESIKWIGRQTIKPNQVKNPLRGYPVLIKAGALGNNLPHRDLYVSPDHSLFIDGLLINAGALVNDISIIKTEPTETFTYYHIELEHHSLVIAEGTAAESYLPQKENREEYDNFAEYEELYPDGSNLMLWPMDYPRISSWNKVPRFVSKKLMTIAEQLFAQDIKIRA